MPAQKGGGNPFEIVPAGSSTSQISPSPARTSVKSGGSNRLSFGGGRAGGRSVSFAGGAKGAAASGQIAAEAVQVSASALKEI